MRKYIICGVICVILFHVIIWVISCLSYRDRMYHFTKHDSLYFAMYDTSQSYSFKTNKGFDTLIITEKYFKEEYNRWHFSEVEGDVFNAYFYFKGHLKHNGHNEEFFVSYTKDTIGCDPGLRIIVSERYTDPDIIEDARNITKPGLYKDTIIVDSLNSIQNHDFPHHFIFKSLKWHKYKGIIGYELSDGTLYTDNL